MCNLHIFECLYVSFSIFPFSPVIKKRIRKKLFIESKQSFPKLVRPAAIKLKCENAGDFTKWPEFNQHAQLYYCHRAIVQKYTVKIAKSFQHPKLSQSNKNVFGNNNKKPKISLVLFAMFWLTFCIICMNFTTFSFVFDICEWQQFSAGANWTI